MFFDVFSMLFLRALWVPIRCFLASFFECFSLLFRGCFRAVKKKVLPQRFLELSGGSLPHESVRFIQGLLGFRESKAFWF